MNVYTIYRNRGKYTFDGEGYGASTPTFMVAAENGEEALDFARTEYWFDGESGILEEINGDRVLNHVGQEGAQISFFPGRVRRLTRKDLAYLEGLEGSNEEVET